MTVALFSRAQIPLSASPISDKLSNQIMAGDDQESGSATRDFRISRHPIETLAEAEHAHFGPEVVELPRISGPPILFAIARDPHTIFTYWYIDWSVIFEKTAPVDREIHLRVRRGDGTEETMVAAEPLIGQHDLSVSQPRGAYRVEIGYYAPEGVWNSVAISDPVIMPPDSVAENVDVDLATIPFHLSFQRLIDLFRASNRDALTEIVSRLQNRAATAEECELLSPEEWEILHAMDLSLDDLKSARAGFAARISEAALRRRAEALLGFGASSPSRSFGGSSWS